MSNTSQPTTYDYASPNQWRIRFDRLPLVTWFCTNANIPGITLGEAQFPTPMSDMPISGDKLTFDTLNIQFIVDEELKNYREIWEWLVGIGFPKQHSQFSSVLSSVLYFLKTLPLSSIIPNLNASVLLNGVTNNFKKRNVMKASIAGLAIYNPFSVLINFVSIEICFASLSII